MNKKELLREKELLYKIAEPLNRALKYGGIYRVRIQESIDIINKRLKEIPQSSKGG